MPKCCIDKPRATNFYKTHNLNLKQMIILLLILYFMIGHNDYFKMAKNLNFIKLWVLQLYKPIDPPYGLWLMSFQKKSYSLWIKLSNTILHVPIKSLFILFWVLVSIWLLAIHLVITFVNSNPQMYNVNPLSIFFNIFLVQWFIKGPIWISFYYLKYYPTKNLTHSWDS
jgi:hypothetical protein